MFGNMYDPFGHDLSNFNGHDILGAMEDEDVYWAGDCADSESSNEYCGSPVNQFGSDVSKSAKKSSAKSSAKSSGQSSVKQSSVKSPGNTSANLVRLNRFNLVDTDTGELVESVIVQDYFEFKGLTFIGVNSDKLILRCDAVGCRLPESSRYVYLSLKDVLWIEDVSANGYVNLNIGLRKATSIQKYVYRLKSGSGKYFEIVEY